MQELPLLSREFLNKLDRLTLMARRLHRKGGQGRTISYRKGSSLEFREYRAYQPGDDVRFVDWNVWERLQLLLTRVFTAEEDRTLYLLLDTSASMGTGGPSKLDFSVKTAAALAYIGGRNQDRVGIFELGADIKSFRRPSKGSGSLFDSFGFLTNLEAAGRTDLTAACLDFLSAADRSGIAVVFTDLFDSGDWREAAKHLLYRRFEVILVHVLSEEDLSPAVTGPVRLFDAETGDSLNLTVDGELLDAYGENLDSVLSAAEVFCGNNGIEYFRVLSSVPFEDFVLGYLGRGEHLK